MAEKCPSSHPEQHGNEEFNVEFVPYLAVNLKHSVDDVGPYVTGLAVMSNGGLILVDNIHNALILTDDTLKIKETLNCARNPRYTLKPYDVALINDKEAVVTHPGSKVLQFVKTFPRLEPERILLLDKDLWGVETSKQNIYLTCGYQKPEVIILDVMGQLQRVIDIKSIDALFGDIKYIAANLEGTKLYVTCSEKILCITVDGQFVFTYSDPDMKDATAVAVNAKENVYVSCFRTNRIIAIESNTATCKTVLTADDGLKMPRGIGYREKDNVLFVGGCTWILSAFRGN